MICASSCYIIFMLATGRIDQVRKEEIICQKILLFAGVG